MGHLAGTSNRVPMQGLQRAFLLKSVPRETAWAACGKERKGGLLNGASLHEQAAGHPMQLPQSVILLRGAIDRPQDCVC